MEQELQSFEAELAQLADGSLSAEREARLRAQVGRSPELQRALAEQERAVSMLRQADAPAPAALHRQIEAMAQAASRRPRQPRLGLSRPPLGLRRPRLGLRLLIPTAAALTAIVAVVVVLGSGGSTPGPSLPQTARLALAAATYPAPSESAGTANTLDQTAAGIPFPYWQRSVGWRAVGARADRVSGRKIVTVFYADWHGARVGYAIVGGAPVRTGGGSIVWRHGIAFTLLRDGSARLVAWVRSGHTCVIAGRDVSDRTLLRLASAA